MARTVSEIHADIQSLTMSEREELLQALLADLDGPADTDVEEAWEREIERRLTDYREGRVQAIPGEEVLKRLRSELD